MPYLGLVGIIFLALVVLVGMGIARAAKPSGQPPLPAAAAPKEPAAPAPAPQSREQLQQKLGELAKMPPPTELRPAAMCYKPVMAPTTAEYVCPQDGQRTQYSGDLGVVRLVRTELPRAREAAKAIKGLSFVLDESEFCRKCSPKVTDPKLVLVVTHPDGKVQKTRGVTDDDLRLIAEFLAGKDRHAGAGDQESPLKDHAERIRELLGLAQK